jgi:small subunit ribosomal protein S13
LARIAGVNLPREKRLEVALTYIYGIGPSMARKVCSELGLSIDEKVRDLTDEEITRLRSYIDGNLEVEGDLRRDRSQSIKRPPGERPADEDERPLAQGHEEDRR